MMTKSKQTPPFNRHIAAHWLLVSVFIVSNFTWFFLPLTILGAFVKGYRICWFIFGVAVLEYVWPLHPGPVGFWPAFSDFSDNTKGLQDYNDAEVVIMKTDGDKSQEPLFRRDKNYCLCYFPHSLYAMGLFILRRYFYDTYGMRLLFTGADVIFHAPILRRLMTWWGCTRVSKSALKKSLAQPYPYNIIMLQPDGIAGMFYGLEHEQIVLDKRRGFCKIALQTGVSLVPCYFLGANIMYDRYCDPNSFWAQLSHNYHMSVLLWSDRFHIPFGPIPKPNKYVFVVGTPIEVQKVEQPTQAQIDNLHDVFVAAMKDLYDKNVYRMGPEWLAARGKLYLESEKLPEKSLQRKKVE